jgi:hypothetical protein
MDPEALLWVIGNFTKHLQQFFECVSIHEHTLTQDLANLFGFPFLGPIHPVVNGTIDCEHNAFDISLLAKSPKTEECLYLHD